MSADIDAMTDEANADLRRDEIVDHIALRIAVAVCRENGWQVVRLQHNADDDQNTYSIAEELL